MAISTNQFLDRLAERDLLEEKVIASLRKQASAKSISATQVAKLLIQKGHLTTFLAKKLLVDDTDDEKTKTLGGESMIDLAAPASPTNAPTNSPMATGNAAGPFAKSSAAEKFAASKTINDDLDLALSNDEVVDLVLVDESSGAKPGGKPGVGPAFDLTVAATGPIAPKAPSPLPAPPRNAASSAPAAPPARPIKEAWKGGPAIGDAAAPAATSPAPPASPAPAAPYTPTPAPAAPYSPAPAAPYSGGYSSAGYGGGGQASAPGASGNKPANYGAGYSAASYSAAGNSAAGYGAAYPSSTGGAAAPSAALGAIDLLNDPLAGNAFGSGLTPLTPLAEPKNKGVFVTKKAKGNRWTSSWMLWLSLLLVGAIGFGAFMFFVLKKGDATEMFQAAEESYQAGTYGQAIVLYKQFLDAFPDDQNSSRARVRIGTATIRQALGGARDFKRPLEVATETLPTIEAEEAFAEGRAELATLLPDIAAGFAGQAQKAKTTQDKQNYADLAMKAMDLVNESKYIPTNLREPQQARIDGIVEDVALVRRDIKRESDFAKALGEIKAAVDGGETSKAFEIRHKLLLEYPGLDSHPELIKAVLAITEAERSLVRFSKDTKKALATDDAAPTASIVLSDQAGPGVAGVEGRSAVVLAPGAVIGLEASSGRVLWRRSVGRATSILPQPVSVAAGADVLVSDIADEATEATGGESNGEKAAPGNELFRLGGLDGKLVWRLPIGEPFLAPVIQRERAYLATRSGKWFEVDLKTGASNRQLSFSQPLSVGPGVDESRQVLFQPANHSNLYVISQSELACDDVVYLGHQAGTIVVPPLVAGGLVLVAINASTSGSELRVLAPDEKTNKLALAQTIRLDGHVVTPLQMLGGRVLLNTDSGSLRIFEIDPSKKDQPLAAAAKFDAASPGRAIGYVVALEGRLWVADTRLARYDVQLARGELSRKTVIDNRSTYVAPLRAFGQAFIHVRRRAGVPGLVATAAHIEDGRVLWETELNSPLAGGAIVSADGSKIAAVSARGRLFEVATADVAAKESGAPIVRSPTKAVDPETGQIFERSLPLGGSLWALVGAGHRGFATLDLAAGDLRKVNPRSLAAGDYGGEAIAYAGAVLSPSKLGPVFLIDPRTGADAALPFQPSLAAAEEVAWRRPTAIGPNGEEFVITDNRRKIYRVGLKTEPARQLAELTAADLDREIVSPLASAGDTVFGVVRDVAFDRAIALSLPDLKPVQEWELSGRVIYGPEAAGVGGLVLAVTDGNTLVGFGPKAQRVWQVAWKHGALAGPPTPAGDSCWLATKGGLLVRISAADGAERRAIDLGEPLGSAAAIVGERLVVAGADGELHIVDAARGG